MTKWTDKHYDFNYTLTEKDIEVGSIKIDPYFVGKVWKTGSRDDSGALAHCLKTIARFGDKNPVEREIKAMYAQVKRLAELNGVTLEVVEQVPAPNNGLWYPDSGEWVEYDGSGQPVEDAALVVAVCRNDRVFRFVEDYSAYKAEDLRWAWDGRDFDIVAYKIVK